MMKSVFTLLLIMSHILVNGVAASVHMTEDYDHEHDVEHSHYFSSEPTSVSDDWQHDHNDEAHMHVVFQLPNTVNIEVSRPTVTTESDTARQLVTTNSSPPVPPPTL